MSGWASVVVASASLVLSIVALGYSRRVRLTVGQTAPIPGGYEIEVVNVGEQAARHVFVYLIDKEDRAASERISGTTISAGERRVIRVPVSVGAQFPLRIRWDYEALVRLPRTKQSSVQLKDQPIDESAEQRGLGANGDRMSLLARWIEIENATPEEVWKGLTDWRIPFGQLDGTWEDKLRRFGGGDMLGEVRSPLDWRNVPAERQLYVVAIEDSGGICIRWASEDARKALGGLTHRHVHRGDKGRTRKGFVTRGEFIRING
jgi:hypothetical protein